MRFALLALCLVVVGCAPSAPPAPVPAVPAPAAVPPEPAVPAPAEPAAPPKPAPAAPAPAEPAAAAAEPWQTVGLCAGGAMFSLAVSPHDANLATISCDMSGAYMTRDGGRTWRMFNHADLQGNTTCAAVFHPAARGKIIAPRGWSGDLCVSLDDGRTWKPYGGKRAWQERPTVLYADAAVPQRLLVGTTAGLFATDDDGATWRRCEGVAGKVLGLATDRSSPVEARVYLVGTGEGVFRSEDGAKTFAPWGEGLPEKNLLAFAGGSDGKVVRLYATIPCKVVDGNLAGGVYVSGDGGRSWQRAMKADLNVQTKRSSEWAHGDVPRYVHALTTDSRPDTAYVYDAGTSYFPPNHSTVYRTDDGGRTWRAILFSDPRFKEYNVEDDWVTKGIGQRWQEVPYAMATSEADPGVVMLCSSAFVLRTDDGGKSWRVCHGRFAPGEHPKGEAAWLNNGLVVTSTWNYTIDPHEKRRHYICYTDIGFARSLDGGTSWIWQGPTVPWRNTMYALAFDPDVPGRLWGAFSDTHDIPNSNVISGRHRVIMQGGVGRSDDFGKTWTKSGLPEAPCLSVVVDPTSPRDARRLYASLFEKGVYRSDDGGKTWTPKSRGLGHPANMRCCKMARQADGTLLCLVTAKRMSDGTFTHDGVGLYRSADQGENWTKITESLPLYWPKDFAVHPKDPKTILLTAANVRGQEESGLYRTTDGGATWAKVVTKGPEHFSAAYHPARPGWIYTTLTEGARESGLYLSKDDGATWQPFLALPFANIQRVHFDPDAPDQVILTTFGGSVFRGPAEPAR
ncbi:MAG TPA: hypothetical protein VM431_14975 [Phycisphaerae bacterium]|nr:hypothetical protein [Phycisphaerae bacterium]